MLHPGNVGLLERARLKGDVAPEVPPFESMADAWHRDNFAALRDGYTAGEVLCLLYALSRAGWKLPPGKVASLRLAIACVAVGAKAAGGPQLPLRPDSPTDVPGMYTAPSKVKKCWKSHRSVAHLWAAVVLHAQGMMPRQVDYLPDLMSKPEWQQVLLAAARPVQDFARGYGDPRLKPRGKKAEPLLGPSPWWVPDGLHLAPVWSAANPAHSVEPRDWLLRAFRKGAA
jgi:hypothetical protein